MNIVPISEAAKTLHISKELIYVWIRRGWASAHKAIGAQGRTVAGVDVNELSELLEGDKRSRAVKKMGEDFILPSDASARFYLSIRSFSYYVKRGYLTPYYLPNSERFYALRISEIEQLDDKIYETRKVMAEKLKEQAKSLKREKDGRFTNGE